MKKPSILFSDDDRAKIRAKDAEPHVESLRDQAIDHAMVMVTRKFNERLGELTQPCPTAG